MGTKLNSLILLVNGNEKKIKSEDGERSGNQKTFSGSSTCSPHYLQTNYTQQSFVC